MKWCKQLSLAVLVTVVAALPAFGQTSTSSITGTVSDPGGGVIPGATVVLTGEAGFTATVVTNSEGSFTFPALQPATYKVTVTLQGFKTAIVENVRVISGNPSNVNVKLEVGRLEENVTVKSSSELINTQTATVSATLNADQLNRMPTTSRNALNAVTFLPGVNTTGSNRASTVNGLPQSMLNITMDGVSNQDNFLKSTDGFFASVYPRQDAVEAVTVTSAAAGANLGGSGAVTIAFTTRSGTNRFSGSAYEYFRHPDLNTNNWANETVNNTGGLPKNQTKLNQYGVRVGGPIKIPGLYDGSGKAFYFFHYEELRFPNNFTKTRSAWVPGILDGNFTYVVNGVPNTVNLLAIGNNPANPKNALDPNVMTILNNIQNSMKTTGVISNTASPLTVSYNYQSPATLVERQPTGRVDFNLSTKHRLSGSASSIWVQRDPDYLNNAEARFPGAPNYRLFKSTRPLYSATLRSTLSSSMVNELRAGLTAVGGAGSRFGQPSDPSQSVASFDDMGGFAVVQPTVTDWFFSAGPSWRAAPTYNLDDSLSLQKGTHAFTFGGGYLLSSAWENAQTVVPTVNLGMVTNTCTVAGVTNPCDPAFNLFTNGATGTLPNAANGDLTNARNIYGMLTGRITSLTNQVALDPATNLYVPNGPRRREGNLQVWSAYAQDSWRVSPTVTLQYGLRYDLQTPFKATNDTMSAVTFTSVCGQSGPGANSSAFDKCDFFGRKNTGAVTEFVQLQSSTKGYETDWNNVAPSISLAWRPNVQSGFLRTILGDPEQATLRGGYSQSYERQGLSTFTGLYGANPGATLGLTRSANNGNLVNAGEQWPLTYSDKTRLYNADYPATVTYPIAIQANRANSLNAFAPDIHIASARTWTVGFQRAITRDMAVDVRYVGTRGIDQWSTLNYNTRDVEANGFMSEFKNAVANLQANNAAGGTRVGSFAYFGPGTGTNPLPVYLAYINGKSGAGAACDSVATCGTVYSGTTWTSTALTGDMIVVNPSPFNSAADLDGDATRRANALATGMPANYFVVNPAVNGNSVTDSGAFSDYHALQIDLRRRLSQGLSANVNYQYALEGGSAFDGFLHGRTMVQNGDGVRHAIKTQWDWTIPVGRGQRYLTDSNAWVDGFLGGWSFKGVGRFQALVQDFGNVRLVGMSHGELQKLYTYNIKTDPASQVGQQRAYMLPDDIILNTRRAFSTSSSTVNGYSTTLGAPEGRYIAPANFPGCIQVVAGDCAPRNLILRAPWFARLDIGVSKRFSLKGSSSIEVAMEVLNVMDNINFTPVAAPGTGETIFSTRGIYQDPNNTYDPGGRLGQLMFRINW
jgi:hypothetical protein